MVPVYMRSIRDENEMDLCCEERCFKVNFKCTRTTFYCFIAIGLVTRF